MIIDSTLSAIVTGGASGLGGATAAMLVGLPHAAQDWLGLKGPHLNRLGKPEEYAQMVEAIIANPMLNGEVIRLDGAIRTAPR